MSSSTVDFEQLVSCQACSCSENGRLHGQAERARYRASDTAQSRPSAGTSTCVPSAYVNGKRRREIEFRIAMEQGHGFFGKRRWRVAGMSRNSSPPVLGDEELWRTDRWKSDVRRSKYVDDQPSTPCLLSSKMRCLTKFHSSPVSKNSTRTSLIPAFSLVAPRQVPTMHLFFGYRCKSLPSTSLASLPT